MWLDNKLEEHHAVFNILGDDVGEAYKRARFYGESMVEFKFAVKYFILGTDKEIHCIPTPDPKKHIIDYYDQYAKRN